MILSYADGVSKSSIARQRVTCLATLFGEALASSSSLTTRAYTKGLVTLSGDNRFIAFHADVHRCR